LLRVLVVLGLNPTQKFIRPSSSSFAGAFILLLLCPISCTLSCPTAANHAERCVYSISVCAALLYPRCSCFLGLCTTTSFVTLSM